MWLLSIAQMLTVVATGAQPGLSVGQDSGGMPAPIPTRQTYFAIPFEIDQIEHPTLGAAEIQLFASRDRGTTWQHETSVAPTTKHFLFRASEDGEYWFSVRTRDRSGNFRPPLVNSPGLRVIVDTRAPGLSIEAQRGQAGEIIAKWRIDEANVEPSTLKLQYRVGDTQQWEDVALDSSKIRSDLATNTGESTWWVPAGTERIQIRAEVADTAGNRNVSHAQVTTVAATTPPANMTAWAAQNRTPPTARETDWQASSGQNLPGENPPNQNLPGQNAWSQQNDYSTGQPPAQTSSTYDPYQQGHGGGSSQMAHEPVRNPGYEAGAYSSSGTGNQKYDPTGSGSANSRYGVDSGIAAQRPQSSVTAPSQPLEASPYSQYAQNQQPRSQQTYESSRPQFGYGSQDVPDPYQARPDNTGYGEQDGAGVGTVAAQPAPAYQSQYNPGGTSSGSDYRQSAAGYGPSTGYGSSPQRSAPPVTTERTVNTKLFEIDYTNPPQPMSVGRVELWGTRDGGVTWQSYGFDSDSRSPMLARIPDEGTYGFTVVFHPANGQPAPSPRRGQRPDIVIRADLTRPDAQVVGVDQSYNALTIRWQAFDAQLAETPIALYYADAATSQWRLIAQNLDNTGSYRWNLPIGLPPEVQIRVEARDRAGNVATAETRNPVRLAQASPPRSSPAPHSVEIQDVRPVGQTGQPAPRRYYIR